MFDHNPEIADSIQCSVAILQKSLEKLDSHDYASAQIMIGVVSQMLSDVQLELNGLLSIRRQLNKLIER